MRTCMWMHGDTSFVRQGAKEQAGERRQGSTDAARARVSLYCTYADAQPAARDRARGSSVTGCHSPDARGCRPAHVHTGNGQYFSVYLYFQRKRKNYLTRTDAYTHIFYLYNYKKAFNYLFIGIDIPPLQTFAYAHVLSISPYIERQR